MALTDESLMPFGAHKGKRMIDVPASYLMWLHDNNRASGLVKEYIDDNLQALKQELNL